MLRGWLLVMQIMMHSIMAGMSLLKGLQKIIIMEFDWMSGMAWRMIEGQSFK